MYVLYIFIPFYVTRYVPGRTVPGTTVWVGLKTRNGNTDVGDEAKRNNRAVDPPE
jgi:hypothetical protein